jgi:hypothetical protein
MRPDGRSGADPRGGVRPTCLGHPDRLYGNATDTNVNLHLCCSRKPFHSFFSCRMDKRHCSLEERARRPRTRTRGPDQRRRKSLRPLSKRQIGHTYSRYRKFGITLPPPPPPPRRLFLRATHIHAHRRSFRNCAPVCLLERSRLRCLSKQQNRTKKHARNPNLLRRTRPLTSSRPCTFL